MIYEVKTKKNSDVQVTCIHTSDLGDNYFRKEKKEYNKKLTDFYLYKFDNRDEWLEAKKEFEIKSIKKTKKCEHTWKFIDVEKEKQGQHIFDVNLFECVHCHEQKRMCDYRGI